LDVDADDQTSDIASIIEAKGIGLTFTTMTNSFVGIHKDHQGLRCPDPIDDHLLERSLGNVYNIPKP
jgi:hypothetical protein